MGLGLNLVVLGGVVYVGSTLVTGAAIHVGMCVSWVVCTNS